MSRAERAHRRRSWASRLDDDVLVAMIRREGRLFVPHGATTLQVGDLLTLIGVSGDVAAATTLFERNDARRAGAPVLAADELRR